MSVEARDIGVLTTGCLRLALGTRTVNSLVENGAGASGGGGAGA